MDPLHHQVTLKGQRLEPDWRVSNFNRVKRNLFLLGYSLKETQYSRDAVAKISDAKKKKIFFGSCFFV